jgi:hypothetical protein
MRSVSVESSFRRPPCGFCYRLLGRTAIARTSRRIGWRPRRPRYVQRLAISIRCHRSNVAGVTKNACQRARATRRLAAVKKSRSMGLMTGRGVRRRRIASSCCSTRISTSLESVGERAAPATGGRAEARDSRTRIATKPPKSSIVGVSLQLIRRGPQQSARSTNCTLHAATPR